MTKMPLAAAAVLLLLSSTTALFAEGAPKSVDAIPLYKGFVLDPGRNETTRSASAADPGGSYRTYTCRTADMTDVLDWYCSEMGMPLGSGMGSGADRDTVVRNGAAGTVSRVRLSVRGPGLEGAEKSKDWEGAQKNLEWLKAQWKEKRRMVNGDFIANALFEWTAVGPNGAYEDIEIRISDESFNWHDMTASQLVELRIGTRSRAENAGLPASMSTAPRLKKISAFLSTPGRSTARRTPA